MDEGNEMSNEVLADIMISLQNYGCHNINFITPTHRGLMILKYLVLGIDNDLKVPLVYNCAGYESLKTIRLLDGIIDIYMPDFKFADSEVAKQYSEAEDYPVAVKAAIKEIYKQVGNLVLMAKELLKKACWSVILFFLKGLQVLNKLQNFLLKISHLILIRTSWTSTNPAIRHRSILPLTVGYPVENIKMKSK